MLAEMIWKEAQELEKTIVEDRRYLHGHPGTGFDTEEAVSYVRGELEKMGYEPKDCGKAGIVALAGGKKQGKVFLLRADMDALPIKEESGLPFAAQGDKSHACGHDMHTAMLLGAARLLKKHEEEIPGTVKLMFQSAEEIFEGSDDMIQAGVLENPKVDAALMIHVMAGMPFAAGTAIVSSPGVSAPAADYFEITVQGKGCHGSMPNMGVDPLNAACHILIALQELSARELSINDRAVLTIGTMSAGNAANAIPDTAVMGGSIRTFDEEIRSFLKKRMVEMAEGIAKTFRAEAKVSFGSGCPSLYNDKEVAGDTLKFMKEILGKERAFSSEELNALSGEKSSKQTGGSEDFAYVSRQVPSVMLALAAGEPKKGYGYTQHHPMVKFDESVLPGGCAVYAYAAWRWLEDHCT
ncbi:MAG: M20 family metallopeptidase [Lachnoclostridium sp.]|nr:M20 family metallopeptidase [Lachnospira sp.]MCM1249064.1 M20 family metallopeptidase [Lachnoclostridium sp.]MCM1535807.1 M20 family metallopeptidase [Clostridium sp.]